MLQVLPSYHMQAMPTCGFCMSASVQAGAVEHGLRSALRFGLRDARAVFVERCGHEIGSGNGFTLGDVHSILETAGGQGARTVGVSASADAPRAKGCRGGTPTSGSEVGAMKLIQIIACGLAGSVLPAAGDTRCHMHCAAEPAEKESPSRSSTARRSTAGRETRRSFGSRTARLSAAR